MTQLCQSTEGGWLLIQIALNLTTLTSSCVDLACHQLIVNKDNRKKQKQQCEVQKPGSWLSAVKWASNSGIPWHRACQYPSSDLSPQSSTPSQTFCDDMHRRLKHVNWSALHGANQQTAHSSNSGKHQLHHCMASSHMTTDAARATYPGCTITNIMTSYRDYHQRPPRSSWETTWRNLEYHDRPWYGLSWLHDSTAETCLFYKQWGRCANEDDSTAQTHPWDHSSPSIRNLTTQKITADHPGDIRPSRRL